MSLRSNTLVALIAGAAASALVASAKADVMADVKAMDDKWVAAFNAKDAAALGALYTEGALLVPPEPIVSGRPAIQKYWEDAFEAGFGPIELVVDQAHESGGAIWAAGHYRLSHPGENGAKLQEQGNYAFNFERQGKDLEIFAMVWNVIEPAK